VKKLTLLRVVPFISQTPISPASPGELLGQPG
jgi:hypothetical protein